MAMAWPGLNGVMPDNRPPNKLPEARPIDQLVQLKLWLTLGARGARGQRRLTRC
jgi:hypothetical protein